jgi:hypothetical protein
MQYSLASTKVESVIWYMPTALEAGRYMSINDADHDQRQ